MNLNAWRRFHGLNYSGLGRALGVSAEAARRYCTGQRHMPASAVLVRIRAMTDGAVLADDFLPQDEAADPAALL